jgi:hypothetical protein
MAMPSFTTANSDRDVCYPVPSAGKLPDGFRPNEAVHIR